MTWTAADDAELDVMVDELVRSYFEHRELCESCRRWSEREPGATPCPHMQNAVGVVIDWEHRRELLSRAEELRREANEAA